MTKRSKQRKRWAIRSLVASLFPFLYLSYALTLGQNADTRLVIRDATYYYLVNSFSVAMGHYGHYFAHPGAPLQAIGGLLVFGKQKVAPESSLPTREEFTENQETYLNLLSNVLIFLNVAALFAVGVVATRRISLLGVVASQAAFFAVPDVIPYIGLYQPEAALVLIGSLYWLALLSRRRGWIWLGMLVGTAVSLKLLFLSYAGAFFSLRPKRKIFWALLLAGGAFLLWGLTLLPEWYLAGDLFVQLAVRQGDYNSGGFGLPNLETIAARALLHFTSETVIAPYVMVLLVAFIPIGWSVRGNKRLKRLFLSAALVILLSAFLYFRKPTHAYYIFPAFGAIPAFVAIYLQLCRRSVVRQLLVLLLFVPLFYFKPRTLGAVNASHALGMNVTPATSAIRAAIANSRECDVIFTGVVPSGRSALAMGAEWAGSDWPIFLDKKYSDTFFLVGPDMIRRFTNPTESIRSWLSSNHPPCALVVFSFDQDKRLEDLRALSLKMTEIYTGRIYQIQKLTFKQYGSKLK